MVSQETSAQQATTVKRAVLILLLAQSVPIAQQKDRDDLISAPLVWLVLFA
jgi:hypothetical protein